MSKLTAVTFLSLAALALVSAQGSVTKLPLPVVLPPLGVPNGVTVDQKNDKWGSCLLYMETLGITVFLDKDSGKNPAAYPGYITAIPQKDEKGTVQTPKHTFGWNTDYVVCPTAKNSSSAGGSTKPEAQNFTLKVEIDADGTVPAKQKDKTLFSLTGSYYFTLGFTTVSAGGWKLATLESTKDFTVKGGGEWLSGDLTVKPQKLNFTDSMEIGAPNNYNYGCSSTKVAIFNVEGNPKVKVGVFFGNFQFQPYNYQVSTDKKKVRFSSNTYDCVGTFTHGSFMGIIVALVLATVLIFGFLMLNSVQTVDRFDDPKQKQLIINAKD